mgnify:CR=1 FL=1
MTFWDLIATLVLLAIVSSGGGSIVTMDDGIWSTLAREEGSWVMMGCGMRVAIGSRRPAMAVLESARKAKGTSIVKVGVGGDGAGAGMGLGGDGGRENGSRLREREW